MTFENDCPHPLFPIELNCLLIIERAGHYIGTGVGMSVD
jgi:hypothetical protein